MPFNCKAEMTNSFSLPKNFHLFVYMRELWEVFTIEGEGISYNVISFHAISFIF